MLKETIFTMKSPYRDDFRIQAFRFGEGTKSLAIVGPMRGDEVQQQYATARIVRKLTEMERAGSLTPGRQIMVIPSCNPFSMNIEKRFWAMDGTDINRMFPGYNLGETTQRIAAALFKALEGYEYGIQLASFYLSGEFIPHVRMLKTGYEARREAEWFGLPYVSVYAPKPYDTTLLNYNWQIWNTKAFSLYAGQTHLISEYSASKAVEAVTRFMQRAGLSVGGARLMPGYATSYIDEANDLITLKAPSGGIFYTYRKAADRVEQGERLARIIDPYLGTTLSEITSPTDGEVFFSHDHPLVLEGAPIYKIIES